MLAIKPVLFPAAGIFLVSLLVAHLYLNRPKPAEFLIETEGEIRKVAWPARKEYLGSSAVVVVVIIILSLYLFAVDKTLSELLVKWLKVGF
jgi:preprotein translocase subunit SecE